MMAEGHRLRRAASLTAASTAPVSGRPGECGRPTMRDTSLLQQALGLAPPWTVGRSDFDPEAHRLDIEIDFAPGSRFACPTCGAANCPAYDTERKTWRHLNFFQHQAYLHARVPCIRCDACGIKTINVPWARPDSGFTLLFEHAPAEAGGLGHDHDLSHAGQGRGPHGGRARHPTVAGGPPLCRPGTRADRRLGCHPTCHRRNRC